MSFDSGLTAFSHTLTFPITSEGGYAGDLWETTPNLFSLMLPYANAYKRRTTSGGCYLGTACTP